MNALLCSFVSGWLTNACFIFTGGSKSNQELCHEQSQSATGTVSSLSLEFEWDVCMKSRPLTPCPHSHKIIILDEADSMTSAAQQALRRTMELYSNTTRFCLACNISTKIIEAIQSRAAILRYSKLSNEEILQCLLRVCQAEEIPYTDDGLEAILFTAEGDMRHALNNLQASYFLASGGSVDQSVVFKVCDQPHPKTVGEIIGFCHKGDTKAAVDSMRKLFHSGYSASDIIGTVFKVVKARLDLPEGLKLEYLREIGFTQMRIADGVNTMLQLMGLVSRLSQKTQESKQ